MITKKKNSPQECYNMWALYSLGTWHIPEVASENSGRAGLFLTDGVGERGMEMGKTM